MTKDVCLHVSRLSHHHFAMQIHADYLASFQRMQTQFGNGITDGMSTFDPNSLALKEYEYGPNLNSGRHRSTPCLGCLPEQHAACPAGHGGAARHASACWNMRIDPMLLVWRSRRHHAREREVPWREHIHDASGVCEAQRGRLLHRARLPACSARSQLQHAWQHAESAILHLGCRSAACVG